jgi:hypothetical protein
MEVRIILLIFQKIEGFGAWLAPKPSGGEEEGCPTLGSGGRGGWNRPCPQAGHSKRLSPVVSFLELRIRLVSAHVNV